MIGGNLISLPWAWDGREGIWHHSSSTHCVSGPSLYLSEPLWAVRVTLSCLLCFALATWSGFAGKGRGCFRGALRHLHNVGQSPFWWCHWSSASCSLRWESKQRKRSNWSTQFRHWTPVYASSSDIGLCLDHGLAFLWLPTGVAACPPPPLCPCWAAPFPLCLLPIHLLVHLSACIIISAPLRIHPAFLWMNLLAPNLVCNDLCLWTDCPFQLICPSAPCCRCRVSHFCSPCAWLPKAVCRELPCWPLLLWSPRWTASSKNAW